MPANRKRKVANPLALAVLATLRERPMHPYEIGRTLRERHKDSSIKINYGSLYMVVEQLARAGYVEAGETVRDNQRPERTVYSLTEPGRTELRDWMRDLLSTPQKEYLQFEAALSLVGVLPPEEVVGLLEQRVRLLAEHTQQTRAALEELVAGGLHPLHLVEEEYQIALAESERAFIEALVRRITTDDDYAREWRQWHKEEQ